MIKWVHICFPCKALSCGRLRRLGCCSRRLRGISAKRQSSFPRQFASRQHVGEKIKSAFDCFLPRSLITPVPKCRYKYYISKNQTTLKRPLCFRPFRKVLERFELSFVGLERFGPVFFLVPYLVQRRKIWYGWI